MEDFVINGKGVLTEYKGDAELLEVPAGVKTIGKDLLGYHKGENVKTVIVPEGVEEIKESAFRSSNISEIQLPSTLKKIGRDAFSSCKNLKCIRIPDGITVIEDSVFCMSGIETVYLPESLNNW